MSQARKAIFRNFKRFLRQKTSLLLTAFMLGMSNVILEEDRSINDTRPKIEHQDVQPEDD